MKTILGKSTTEINPDIEAMKIRIKKLENKSAEHEAIINEFIKLLERLSNDR